MENTKEIKKCEHNLGIYSRGNTWFCSGCNAMIPAPEMPESVKKRCADWYNLSWEDQCKKYGMTWDGTEFERTYQRLGFWGTVNKYGLIKAVKIFLL